MNREQVDPHYSIHRAHGNMSAAGVRRSDTDHDGDGGNDVMRLGQSLTKDDYPEEYVKVDE